VPRTRGREISRPAAAILEEATHLVDQGVCELTLLGQTVNAYGRHDLRRGESGAAGTMPFSELLAHLDAIPGLERLRYTSPHPIFFDQGLIRAHGELESLCPHVHLPAQSGSDRVLEAMRRRYRADELREIAVALREARPDLVITTDLIVGFPSENDRDFDDTLRLVEEVGFVDSYSFKYSPRPETRAAELGGAVPPDLAQKRLEALQQLQRELTIRYHRSRIGDQVEVLLEGLSRRGNQLSGRDAYHRVVNLSGPCAQKPGDFAWAQVVEATPHSLIGEPVQPANLLEIASFH
jgi:tRNA-2-methylthio-N6-dimethylallyladenosine synthase